MLFQNVLKVNGSRDIQPFNVLESINYMTDPSENIGIQKILYLKTNSFDHFFSFSKICYVLELNWLHHLLFLLRCDK